MKRLILVCSLVSLVLSCQNERATTVTTATSTEPPATAATQRDPHSYSRPDEVRVEHIALDLAVDFAKKQLAGTATLRIRHETQSPTLVLDTHTLDIRRVTLQPGNTQAQFKLGAADPIFGRSTNSFAAASSTDGSA